MQFNRARSMWTLTSLNCWSLSLGTKRTGSKSSLASWRSGFSAWHWGCWPPALATPLTSWHNSSTVVKPKKSPRHQRGTRRRCRAGTETVETVQHCPGRGRVRFSGRSCCCDSHDDPAFPPDFGRDRRLLYFAVARVDVVTSRCCL